MSKSISQVLFEIGGYIIGVGLGLYVIDVIGGIIDFLYFIISNPFYMILIGFGLVAFSILVVIIEAILENEVENNE